MLSTSPRRLERPTYRLGVLVRSVNSSQGTFILVKESLDFSNFPVILCQNKKIEIHLCKTLFDGIAILRVQPLRSIEFISMATIPAKLAVMITLFSY